GFFQHDHLVAEPAREQSRGQPRAAATTNDDVVFRVEGRSLRLVRAERDCAECRRNRGSGAGRLQEFPPRCTQGLFRSFPSSHVSPPLCCRSIPLQPTHEPNQLEPIFEKSHTRSTTTAMPCPTPMHIVHNA